VPLALSGLMEIMGPPPPPAARLLVSERQFPETFAYVVRRFDGLEVTYENRASGWHPWLAMRARIAQYIRETAQLTTLINLTSGLSSLRPLYLLLQGGMAPIDAEHRFSCQIK